MGMMINVRRGGLGAGKTDITGVGGVKVLLGTPPTQSSFAGQQSDVSSMKLKFHTSRQAEEASLSSRLAVRPSTPVGFLGFSFSRFQETRASTGQSTARPRDVPRRHSAHVLFVRHP